MTGTKDTSLPDVIAGRFDRARARRSKWEPVWQDCYRYALPYRDDFSGFQVAARRGEDLFDATAPDAVDQLASLLLGYLTPPLTPWFAIKAGTDISDEDAQKMAPMLDQTTRVLQAHFDQSNFLVEVHQCFLDQVYRTLSLTGPQILERYGDVDVQSGVLQKALRQVDLEIAVVEAVVPLDHGYAFLVFDVETQEILVRRKISQSPFISFRWMKTPGEIYGRSPVMKALPDIKTANKVVELTLKNASIAVTGIWQAEDDGVINPANIELVPGAIIPKAVGSKGLTPLEMPARFDVSQLVLDDLRSRIRHALLSDRFVPNDRKATATEILQRSSETALFLGATFGRLQVEFLNPLIQRAYGILRRRGVVPDLPLDGRTLAIEYRSPLARAQAGQHVQTMLGWLNMAQSLGGEAMARINRVEVMEYLARVLGVPAGFLNTIPQDNLSDITKGE